MKSLLAKERRTPRVLEATSRRAPDFGVRVCEAARRASARTEHVPTEHTARYRWLHPGSHGTAAWSTSARLPKLATGRPCAIDATCSFSTLSPRPRSRGSGRPTYRIALDGGRS